MFRKAYTVEGHIIRTSSVAHMTRYKVRRKSEKVFCFRCRTFMKVGDWYVVYGEGRTYAQMWYRHVHCSRNPP